ncbi:MAG: hypothetical protein HXX13_03540 [Bacteroidetes bacterium]|nr:hypothetical protein [Bacteroidota bacterium]
MNRLLRLLSITTMLILLNSGFLTNLVYGQFSIPPPPPAETSGSSNMRGPMGSGAPIGDGAWILITLVVGYGIHTYKVRRKSQEKDEEK